MRIVFWCFLASLVPTIAAAQAEYVVVPKRAKLYTSNEPASTFFTIDEDGYNTFLFVEQRGPRFRVRTVVSYPQTTCYDAMPLGDDFELDFWVQSKDVMWVTTTAFEERYHDTFISLKPGVVLQPGSSSQDWKADVGLEIPVVYEDAGKRFVPKRIEGNFGSGSRIHAKTFYLGPMSFTFDDAWEGRQTSGPNGDYVEFSRACATGKLRVEGLTTAGLQGYGGMSGMGSSHSGIATGAPVYWPTGQLAGRYVGQYVKFVRREDVTREIGTTYCFEFGGLQNGLLQPYIELCIDREDVINFK